MRGTIAVAAFFVIACGDDARTEGDASVGPGEDSGPRADAGPSVDAGPGVDAGPVAPVTGWAPQPWEDCEGGGVIVEAGPSDYRAALDALGPGDTLRLGPGDYDRGLPIRASGTPDACIVIEGTPGAARPRILGSDSFNVVSLRAVSWVKVRGLDLDGLGLAGDGVKSEGGEAGASHHVVIEDLHMVGFGGSQQTVGVSTKTPAWDWVVRGNTISGAGTGLYLGNSDGSDPFVRGVIELNAVVDTIGYNMQIKHQTGRPALAGMPTEDAETVVRWNVFSKESGGSSGGDARPNFLLGHLPTSGTGTNDRYLVYGNFFHENPNENLVQAEGNVIFYANVLSNRAGGAAVFQPHNDVPREIDVFLNTVVSTGRPIRITGGDPAFQQRVRWNAVFSDQGIDAAAATENLAASLAEADTMLASPSAPLGGGLDLHPVAGALAGAPDLASLAGYAASSLDFDARARDGTTLGAYGGPATAASWPLARSARPYGP
jgi:hypothetical protein